MKKKEGGAIILASVLVVGILVASVATAIVSVNKKMTQYCFEELETTSQGLAQDLYTTMHTDKTMLTALADIIAGRDDLDDEGVLDIINSFNLMDSYISSVAILREDNTLMDQRGRKVDAVGRLKFASEIQKGAYISEEDVGILDPEDRVVRNVVPVVKEGQTIAMLYGIVSLKNLAEVYKTNIYDGQAYVYLVDGATGDFLVDNWHETRGNIKDYKDRKTAPGYSFDQTEQDMKKGKSGDLCFISRSTGNTMYMHYEPTGVNELMVLVSVDNIAAFKKTNAISRILYIMATVTGTALLVYMAFIVVYLVRMYKTIHKLDTEDQTTQLQNRNAYDAFTEKAKSKRFDNITCVYIDANGLHEINNRHGHKVGDQMLRIIANALKSEFPYKSLYRIGGDEFVVLCEHEDEDACSRKMSSVMQQIEQHEYTISLGVASRADELGIDRVISEADTRMLEYKRMFYAGKNHDRRKVRE